MYGQGRRVSAVEAGHAGRSAVASMGAPPAITTGIGHNAAASLVASGRWVEADQLLADLLAESTTNFTRYLQLLQLELAVCRGEAERAADLAATLRKSPDDPRLVGSLHAWLAEQALNTDNLAVMAIEVVAGLTASGAAADGGRVLFSLDTQAPVPVVQIALLRSLPLLAELPAPALERLASTLVPVEVPAGTVLIRPGEEADACYAIAAGQFDVLQDGRFIRRCERGEAIGQIALPHAVPRTASVIARTNATVYKLARETFLTG